MNDEPPLELLDRAYAALSAEFAARRPEDHTFTWYDPDQTVGFWIRDMAQETCSRPSGRARRQAVRTLRSGAWLRRCCSGCGTAAGGMWRRPSGATTPSRCCAR